MRLLTDLTLLTVTLLVAIFLKRPSRRPGIRTNTRVRVHSGDHSVKECYGTVKREWRFWCDVHLDGSPVGKWTKVQKKHLDVIDKKYGGGFTDSVMQRSNLTKSDAFKQGYAKVLIDRLNKMGVKTVDQYNVDLWPQEIHLPPIDGEACLLKTDVVNSTNQWAHDERMFEKMQNGETFLREVAEDYKIHIAERIGDSMVFAAHDPENMIRFAIEIYRGFRIASEGIKIRIGVWHGDVTDHVGINFSGFTQYYGYPYDEVKKIEESTNESLALSESFYTKLKGLDLPDLVPYVNFAGVKAVLGRNEVPIRQIDFESIVGIPRLTKPTDDVRTMNPPFNSKVTDQAHFVSSSEKVLEVLARQIGIEVEQTTCDEGVADAVPFGIGGIMFAKVVTENTQPDDDHGCAFGTMCCDMLNRINSTDGVCLLEETDDCFLVSCSTENTNTLFKLAHEMHEVMKSHAFSLKIAIHYGPMKTGVNRYGMPCHWGKPMNECCRMFKGMAPRQTSISQEFYCTVGHVIRGILDNGRSEVIQAKGADGKLGRDGSVLNPGEMCRIILEDE